MTPIQKAKEIIISYLKNVVGIVDHKKVDKYLASPEAAAILSGEDWKEDVIEWEYLRAAINNDIQLNAKGSEGWELCVIEKLLGGKDYIFKRPKISNQ